MGILRLFLAMSVIAGHAKTTVFGFNGIGAWYAVNFFFIISGFYMAMVLNEKYKDINPIYFYKSRALRLFPAYYIGVFIAIIVSFTSINDFFNHLSIGAKLYFIFQNIFIFGQDLSYLLCIKSTSFSCAAGDSMSINPPAWSLAVELGFYLIAPYILKSEKKTFAFVVLGCIYLLSLNRIYLPVNSVDFFSPVDITALNYYFYPSSFSFFGGGALAYHLSKRKTQAHYYAAIFSIILFSFTHTIMPFWHLLFISMAIPVLFNYTAKNRLDRSIGELSYPAYILHFPILVFLRPFTQSHPLYFSFISLGSWVAIISCITGLLLYFYIEKTINVYRMSEKFFGSIAFAKNNFVSASTTSILVIYLIFPFTSVTYIYLHQKVTTHPVNFTDKNWIKGIGRISSIIKINNTLENINRYSVDKVIKFSNNDIRKIIKVETSEQFLNIHIDGNPLDGLQVGFPNKIEIVK